MLDIEYVSEIFVLTMDGVQDSKEYLDTIYANFDDEIPEVDERRLAYEACKEFIATLWPHLTTSRFRNLADFYSLWAACLDVIEAGAEVDLETTGAQLSEFAEAVREADDEVSRRYLVSATQGSNKAPNRLARAEILKTFFSYE